MGRAENWDQSSLFDQHAPDGKQPASRKTPDQRVFHAVIFQLCRST